MHKRYGQPYFKIEQMGHFRIFLLGLIISFSSSAQSNKRILQLSGTISEKYPIKMTLTIQNDKVLGFYYYEKYKTKILLEGQRQNEKVILKESPDYESEFKIGFIGELRDNSFKGTWTDKQKNKTLNFQVVVDSDKQMILNDQLERVEGTYNNKLNSDKYTGTISLTLISNDIFCFEISNGTESGCVGYLKGLISLKDLSRGIYTGDQCKGIEFSLSDNNLTLTEENCEWHGVRCPFSGEYQKK
jgi:hypothetical protein